VCIKWTNLSPYLIHLVLLDVQKCTKYVNIRASKEHIPQNPFVKIHNTVFWDWKGEASSLSSTHYVCAGSGRQGEEVQRALYQCMYGEPRLIVHYRKGEEQNFKM
jgi:hypothetical protein